MSLIAFHRFLIATAIVFCLGFAAWEVMVFSAAGRLESLSLGLVFGALGVGLIVYLRRLNRILGLQEDGRATGP